MQYDSKIASGRRYVQGEYLLILARNNCYSKGEKGGFCYNTSLGGF